ncbi:hypothetical protein [Halogeometricum sp. CBA1124]|uniref:hypothetical protein n=1 Tax=Halogeometricum sp. CBA1124 TaxID=2668071 RepID=UPI0014299952|nr:hypothetical protein [Halogeometricum sp. CBA1124]MUV59230.1 hypothetical protein [Halogeometricum sp. CBA1124]
MNAARLLALVVAVSLLVPVGAVGGVPAVRLTVSDAVVAPATPVVGEQVTVTVTVANSVGSESAVSVDQLRLTTATGKSPARRASGRFRRATP